MYKTILTYLSSPQSAPLVSEVSAYLADKHRAHLAGVHQSARISLYGGIPADMLAQHNHSQREMAEAIEKTFRAAAASRNLELEWRHKAMRDTEVMGDIIDQARSGDLVVACADDEADPLASFHDVPVRLVMETGRPVLLVPAKGSFQSVGERVTIAWNHSRESARAAFDALPLLKAASEVQILAVNSTKDGATQPGADLAASLARHGVNAKAEVAVSRSNSDGEALMSAVAAHGSDLLVMGCYGRPRFLELVLGGVTKYVLRHMRVPVLMSH
jgi:nucleotide-binding universal stress UspA family protein